MHVQGEERSWDSRRGIVELNLRVELLGLTAPDRILTCNLPVQGRMLSIPCPSLSSRVRPGPGRRPFLLKPTEGFEPSTPALRKQCSGHLSYVGVFRASTVRVAIRERGFHTVQYHCMPELALSLLPYLLWSRRRTLLPSGGGGNRTHVFRSLST